MLMYCDCDAEVRFASFYSCVFITAIVVNPPERKLAKRTSVQCFGIKFISELVTCVSTRDSTLCVFMFNRHKKS